MSGFEFKSKSVHCESKDTEYFPVLKLDMNDKTGKEYCDGDIVKCAYKIGDERYPMVGYIRYFGGRFEVVCPFQNERYILGLNPMYEIVGHVYTHSYMIDEQTTRPFKKENGVKA